MTTPSPAQVREWARSQGIEVADRGRLPDELRDAYLKATGSGAGVTESAASQAGSSGSATTGASPRVPQGAPASRPGPAAAAMAGAEQAAEAALANAEQTAAAALARAEPAAALADRPPVDAPIAAPQRRT